MTKILLIALGGGVGAALRYALSGWIHRLLGVAFPWGTLGVNLLACLLLGMAAAWLTGAGAPRVREEWKLALTVGLLGGFSTFSTWAFESFASAQEGDLRAAGANIIGSALLGLLCVWIGYRFIEWTGAG